MFKIKKLYPIVAGLFLLTGLLSCSDDEEDYVYPSVLSEFADVYSGSDRRLVCLQTDGGQRLEILNASTISTDGVVADTVYRSLVRYERKTAGAEIYAIQMIAAPEPDSPADFPDGIKDDPVEMQSLWQGGDYLNMILLVKAQNARHTFRFVSDSITSSRDGVKTLHFRLYHDAGGDVQAYTQKAYLSLPLTSYKPLLSRGDTLSFSIPTTTGWQRWKRCY